jgi:acyl-CoA thioesterase-1
MRLKFLLVLMLSGIPFPMLADSAVVILGDSLSAAYGMEIHQSWPSLLQERLIESGYTQRVFNSSITGDTTQSGVARLPRLLKKSRTDVVILELGGNDGMRGLPIEVTGKNLSSMIEMSQSAGASVILSEMRIPPNYGRTYTEKFNAMYTELADQYGITLMPFILNDIALQPGLMQSDGIHPTAEAQPLILDKVWQQLEPLLK